MLFVGVVAGWAVALAAGVNAQKGQFPPLIPPSPILPSAINAAPSVVPNIQDKTAPNAQTVCPGYKAANVKETAQGLTAYLTLNGPACHVYGNDVPDLKLTVEYQDKSRLRVAAEPRWIGPNNRTQYVLDANLTPLPTFGKAPGKNQSDLHFEWSNDPSFQFKVSRVSSGEVLFNTYGKKMVFEDQFLELATSMVNDYNVYGLAESLRSFRLGTNTTITHWAAYNLDNDQEPEVNGHSVHPMYLETRYHANSSSTSHGVFARNAHGQEWLLRPDSITYRTIGGSFDFYFLSGSTPKDVLAQYQTGIIRTPVMMPYWALGFHQVRWGYQNWTNLQEVIDLYAAQNIQLESVMNDLDYLKLTRDFTTNPGHYDVGPGREFLARLHRNGQKWVPILDPNIYVPDPGNATDAYSPYDKGVELNAFLRNGNDSIYYGVLWPGFSAYPDFLVPQTKAYWAELILAYHNVLPFDGFWLDVNDYTSFCTGSCGEGLLHENPIHVPFPLPGDSDTSIAIDYRYPEGFEVTNATEAASASKSAASQSAAYPTPSAPVQVMNRTLPTPNVRNLNFPPYAINNFLEGHSLVKQVISPNATHNDGPFNTTEYELHNLAGHMSGNATYQALQEVTPGERPFFLSRSTFPGSGSFAGHWFADSNSKFGDMYWGISQALQLAIAGIPFVGPETCGFNGNADLELCTRWMQLSAWFPLYRNHNNRNTLAQEAYRWATTAESTRRIMNIRYSLLPYTYTLFHEAHRAGGLVLRALAWEFPNDPQLRAIETQFMSGPAILITPVLAPLATNVSGVFPGVAEGTKWYDWYTYEQVNAKPGENKTLQAPLLHQPIHIRGGFIIPLQKAGNTTSTSRKSPWSLIAALDKNGKAEGELYLDDGVSIVPASTKDVKFRFDNNTLSTIPSGTYEDRLPLANVTIAGITGSFKSVSATLNGTSVDTSGVKVRSSNGTLFLTNLDLATKNGVWSADFKLQLRS